MDLDISDILADVSRPSQHHTSATNLHYDATTSHSDHQLLVRAWTSERCTPSLLPYPTALIERTTSRIRDQITQIEDLTSGISDQYSSSGGAASGGNSTTRSNNTNLILSILQTDLSRTQFILRSYLRQRLAKLTKYAGFYLQQQQQRQQNSDGSTVLSTAELTYLTSHQALLSEFYDSCFLSALPANLRRLDDTAGGVSMIDGPDGATGVVVRCLKGAGWDNVEGLYVQREEGEKNGGFDDDHEGASVELRMRRGEVWVVRWRDVRDGVVSGDLEVL